MPTTNFNPTVIGGSIGVQGDVGTGAINQQAQGQATGGSFSLAIPMIPLQNLAWLGEDGQVHTVKQLINGGPRLVGSAAPPMLGSASPLQNLAWLGEDGQVHTI